MEKFSTYYIFDRDKAPWLYQPQLQKLLAALEEDGEEARIVGGAVRDTILSDKAGLGEKAAAITDIDIAATALPEAVMRRVKAAGFAAVPVGIEFGTVLAAAHGQNFQITTLRTDSEADGRHAKVHFCRDFALDARRRDFTVNALYVDKQGRLYDYCGGAQDIESGILRFIGAPSERIKEDYLRILRFFRFYAYFGKGRPDAAALKAIAALKGGMEKLSAERVGAELKKLLAAPNPQRSLLWMRTSGVLSLILPESGKWGLDALQGLLENEALAAQEGGNAAERGEGGAAAEEGGAGHMQDSGGATAQRGDALLRLMAIIPPQPEKIQSLSLRLSLSRREKRRLLDWAEAEKIQPDIDEAELKKRIYLSVSRRRKGIKAEKGGEAASVKPTEILDYLQIAAANARIYGHEAECRAYAHLAQTAQNWPAPYFPVSGGDIEALGGHGAAVGRILRRLEKDWIESGFALDKAALLRQAAAAGIEAAARKIQP